MLPMPAQPPSAPAPATSATSRRSRCAASIRRLGAAAMLTIVALVSACGTRTASPLPRLVAVPRVNLAMASQDLQQVAALGAAQQHLQLRTAADWYLSQMSLEDQLGQMLMNESDGTVYSADMARMVEQEHIGGIILFWDNYGTFDQTRTMLRQVQAHARIPLLLATDQEGGDITRISQYYGWFPWARDLANSGDPQVAYNAGRQAALDLQQLGINADFSPVVDVPTSGDSWAWTTARAFSEDPKVVAQYAGAYMAGIKSVDEVSCLKHFPGLGGVTVDPHEGLPVVNSSLSQLWQTDLYPFEALIPQMPPMMMSTDVLMPAVDPVYPAELSKAWITGILRDQMHYDGVVITDALWMKGISDRWDAQQAALLAVEAGNDIIIGAYNATQSQQVLDALKAAVLSGQISATRIQDSVRRVLMLKLQFGLLPMPTGALANTNMVGA
jgi:beta-N-acetylhexosaminidase